jgi:thiamine-monophosphate kinase
VSLGDERQILARIAAMAPAPRNSGVVLGIGDDCAIYRPTFGEELVLTTDMVIEDVHFRRHMHPPEAVGYKALARGLSDIAAMGATPRFCLVSLAVAGWVDEAWIDGFYRGLCGLAEQTGTHLAGGDLSHGRQLVCDVVVAGSVVAGEALRRDGAQPGDILYISGTLGGAALGLHSQQGEAWQRHTHPVPRLALGRRLRELGVTACMDLSDGLSLDLQRLCLASKVAALLAEEVPVFPGASLEQALHGGDDYELLFTAPAERALPGRLEDVRLTRIGTIVAGDPGVVTHRGTLLEPLGYDHFRQQPSDS